MTWAHVTIAGLTLELIGAAVVTLAVFLVGVPRLYEQALAARSSPEQINARAKRLGEERAHARAGVGLITLGIVLQLAAVTFDSLHGMTEWLFALAAVGVPILVAVGALKFLVRHWNKEVSDARARPEHTQPW
jgi:hypothetical protein